MNNEENSLIEATKNKEEEAKNTLYDNYKYIVDILLKKYYTIASNLNIDMKELEGEAYYAFSDALNSFQSDKNAKLSTFLSLCIDRRIKKIIKKYSSDKAKALNNAYSLDYDYNEEGTTLKDLISDENQFDPLYNLTNKENYEELLLKIKSSLSESEYEVFIYMINDFDYVTIALLLNKNPKQIDNTIQRIKHKIKEITLSD